MAEMDDNFPMFRWGGAILLVILLTAGAATLVERWAGSVDDRPRKEAARDDDDDGDDGKEAKASAGPQDEAALIAAMKGGGGGAQFCRTAAASVSLPPSVHESSGVVASRRTPGLFWTHNDSGDPHLYAVDEAGHQLGRVRVEGATMQDWEDIAAGPCPGGQCLYVADTGDNAAKRPEVTVWRVPEPAPGDARTAPAEGLRARYPDGPHDAEALFVLPTGQIHIVTKGVKGHVAIYRFPVNAGPGAVTTLERVRELSGRPLPRPQRITGASASPDGRWVALRTLNSLSVHPTEALLAGRGDTARVVDLSPLSEPQGEAVTFAGNGTMVLTSEGGKRGIPGTLSVLRCDLAE